MDLSTSIEQELEQAFREELGEMFSQSRMDRLVERVLEIVPRWIAREPD